MLSPQECPSMTQPLAGGGGLPSEDGHPQVIAMIDNLPVIENGSGRLLKLRARLAMKRETFARLVPMSIRSLANIESGKVPSAPLLRQLKQLRRVIDALCELMPQESIGSWLEEPNDAFGGLKPLEVIERGEVDRIWQLIFRGRSVIAG